jgi:hypothetical protein
MERPGRIMISKSGNLSWIGHLGEIRKRLILIVVVLVSCMGIGFFLTGHVLRFLLATQLPAGVGLNAFSPFDSLQLYMRFSLAIGLAIAIPFILYQIWCFAKPGLRDEERKAALAYIPLAASLFLAGLAFGSYAEHPSSGRTCIRAAGCRLIPNVHSASESATAQKNASLRVHGTCCIERNRIAAGLAVPPYRYDSAFPFVRSQHAAQQLDA